MIISTEKKFIFIANLKNASSSIESELRKHGDVKFSNTSLGKHMTIEQLEEILIILKSAVFCSDYFRFGVMRNPIDYVLSVYNSHSKKAFEGKSYYTGNTSLSTFIEKNIRSKIGEVGWQLEPQRRFFTDRFNMPRMHFIAAFENLNRDFKLICEHLGLEEELGVKNCSPKLATVTDLSSSDREFLENHYSLDFEFYEKYVGRFLM